MKLDLEHYSSTPGLTQSGIDPSHYGQAEAGAEAKRRQDPNWVDRSFYYVKGGEPEKQLKFKPYKYHAQVDAEKIYDADKDPLALQSKLKWANDWTEYEKAIKDAGFHGYRTPTNPNPIHQNTVVMFHPVTPHSVDNMRKSQISRMAKSALNDPYRAMSMARTMMSSAYTAATRMPGVNAAQNTPTPGRQPDKGQPRQKAPYQQFMMGQVGFSKSENNMENVPAATKGILSVMGDQKDISAKKEPMMKCDDMSARRWEHMEKAGKWPVPGMVPPSGDKNPASAQPMQPVKKDEGAPTEFLSKPPVSEAQRKAMFAAAAGNSTIGIPKKVGKEFADADKGGKLPEHSLEKGDVVDIKTKKVISSKPTVQNTTAPVNHDKILSSIGKLEKLMAEMKKKAAEKQLDKSYEGFNKLKGELSHEKGVKDPAAVAASIGMKKYGKEKFEHAAHEGKKMEKAQSVIPSADSTYNKEVAAKIGIIKGKIQDKQEPSLAAKIGMMKKKYLKKSLIWGGKKDEEQKKPRRSAKEFLDIIHKHLNANKAPYEPAPLDPEFKKKLLDLTSKPKDDKNV